MTRAVVAMRQALAREKTALIASVERNWKEGRVNLSAESAARLARVQLLEELLDLTSSTEPSN